MFFIIVAVLVRYFSKNMIIVLGIPLILVNLMSVKGNFTEGLENNAQPASSTNNSNTSFEEYKIIDLLPKNEQPTMKNELKSFLKKQLNMTSSGTDISMLDSMTFEKSYSEFK